MRGRRDVVIEICRTESEMPFHGMDDQAYGQQERPSTLDDSWIAKYNTRWVGSIVLEPRR